MRILYVHQYFTTPEGATGTRSYEFARRLLARGHQVTMLCASYKVSKTGLSGPFAKGRREGNVDGIDVVEFQLEFSNRTSLPQRAIVFLRFAWRSIKMALREDYDLIFATSTPLTAAIPGIAQKWFGRRKRPFVFEIRDPWPEAPRDMGLIKNRAVLKALDWLETWAYRAADRYIALSPGMIEAFKKKGVEENRITLIPNGSDLNLFKPSLEPSALSDWPCEGFTALFCGAHGVANGLHTLVDAAATLDKADNLEASILLVGDGKQKPALVERVQKENLRTIAFHEPIPKTKLAQWMAQAGVGLMILENVKTFHYSSSPNKFFDYISAGLPVIVNHPGWVADMLTEHDCGVFVKPGDSEGLAEAILWMSRNEDRRKTMGANARKLAEAQFDRDKLGERFVEVLELAAKEFSLER